MISRSRSSIAVAGSLEQPVARSKPAPLTPLENAVVQTQMAAALYYVHSQGFLHLDFKPANLLVREDASIVLHDIRGNR